jgi:hypothetical protein
MIELTVGKRHLEYSRVMPGLVPGIHVLSFVDGRDKPGHDEKKGRG